MGFSIVFCVAILATVFLGALGSDEPEFSYHGDDGPDQWPTLFEDFCGGEKQSPINIETNRAERRNLGRFQFSGYDRDYMNVLIKNDGGHTIKVLLNESTTNAILFGGGLNGNYKLIQVHFHWGHNSRHGSEHTMNGESQAFEMHLVHRNTRYSANDQLTAPDSLAVLGVFIREGGNSENPEFLPITNTIHQILKVDRKAYIERINFRYLLPRNIDTFYRYTGSLTTPHCNEIVTWTVFEEPKIMAEGQMWRFRQVRDSHGHHLVDNYRPPQPLKGRPVYRNN